MMTGDIPMRFNYNHMIVEGIVIFCCEHDQCIYTTTHEFGMGRHIKAMHDKIKDFKCDKCKYACSDEYALKKHIKHIHDKIKDFKCDKCKYECSTNRDLKRHKKKVHDKKNVRLTNSKYNG